MSEVHTDITLKDIKVGDGATICLYTDRHACTVIKRTAKTITLQRDKATLLNKPEFIPGGFVGHCTNNNSLEYSYESDPEGSIAVAHWSEKHQGYFVAGRELVIPGRHEFYDYNF